MTPDAAQVQNRLKVITDYVRDCESRVARGEVVDMTGLDRNVSELCTDIGELPRTEAQGLQDKLLGLVTSLDGLAAVMKEQTEKLAAMAGMQER